jgi:MFS family permease
VNTTNNQPTGTKQTGFFPWVVWALGATFFAYAFFQRFAPSPMGADLMRDFAVSGAILGNLSAFYFYSYASLQIPVGIMMDYWGPRRVLTWAAMIAGAGSLLFGTAESVFTAYLGRALIGAGVGFAWVGTLKLITIWFPLNRFAFVSGLAAMIGLLGSIASQAPLAHAVAAVGWRWTLIWAAVFAFVLGAAIWFIVRDGATGERVSPAARRAELMAGLRRTVRNRQTWVIALFGGCITAPQACFAGLWGVPYFMGVYGLDRPEAAWVASMLLFGWAAGLPTVGWVSDRIKRRRLPMIVGTSMGLITLSAAIYVPGLPLWSVMALLVVNGFFSACMVLSYATSREHNPPAAAGAAVAFVNMSVMAVPAVFQPIIGLILDWNWDGTLDAGARLYSTDAYHLAFLSLVGCGITAVIAAVLTGETRCNNVFRESGDQR